MPDTMPHANSAPTEAAPQGKGLARAFRGAPGPRGTAALLTLVVGGVLVLTLTPRSGSGIPRDQSLCLLCGRSGTANLVRNVLLFVPVGAAFALRWGPGIPAVLAAVALTVGIETAQIFIPGRSSLPVDVAANAAGGLVGVALVRWGAWWDRLSRRGGALASLAWAVAVAGSVPVVAALFQPDLPQTDYWGQWTPRLGDLEVYEGRVLETRLGNRPLPSARLSGSPEIRRALLDDAPLQVRAELAPPPPGPTPIFSLHDEGEREVALLGVEGEDLVWRLRYRANALGLQRPDVRWPNALAEREQGDTVQLAVTGTPGPPCLHVDGERRCGLGPRFQEGWSLLLFTAGGAPALRRGLDALWVALLFLPFGLLARLHPASMMGAVVLGVALAGAGWLPGLAPTGGWGSVGGGVGAAVGVGLQRRRGTARPLGTQSARPP